MTDDERRLLEFVVWEVRVRDLPADVGEAALRVASSGSVPRPERRPRIDRTYAQGRYHVTLIPHDETAPMQDAFPLDVGAHVDGHLEELTSSGGWVLVQDTSAEGEQDY